MSYYLTFWKYLLLRQNITRFVLFELIAILNFFCLCIHIFDACLLLGQDNPTKNFLRSCSYILTVYFYLEPHNLITIVLLLFLRTFVSLLIYSFHRIWKYILPRKNENFSQYFRFVSLIFCLILEELTSLQDWVFLSKKKPYLSIKNQFLYPSAKFYNFHLI